MRILVTGGAGFIGGHLAESFVEDGHDVTVLDNLDPYYDIGIKEHNVEAARQAADRGDGSYEFVEEDVRDQAVVSELIADVDIVYHQAAQAGVGEYRRPPKTERNQRRRNAERIGCSTRIRR